MPKKLGNIISSSLLTKLQISLGEQHVQLKSSISQVVTHRDVPLKSPHFWKGFATHVKVASYLLATFKLRSCSPPALLRALLSPQPISSRMRMQSLAISTQHRTPLVGSSCCHWAGRHSGLLQGMLTPPAQLGFLLLSQVLKPFLLLTVSALTPWRTKLATPSFLCGFGQPRDTVLISEM